MNGAHERGLARMAPVSEVAIAPRGRYWLRRDDETGRALVSVAHVSGGVFYGRGVDADAWRPASVGLPMTTGDRLYTARGASLSLGAPGFEIHLGSATGIEAVDLSGRAKRFYVWGGSAAFLVRRLYPGESFEVDTPNAGVTFELAGEYRIDLDGEGSTNVVVDRGSARVSTAGVGTRSPLCRDPLLLALTPRRD